jgi:hypothetical protein
MFESLLLWFTGISSKQNQYKVVPISNVVQDDDDICCKKALSPIPRNKSIKIIESKRASEIMRYLMQDNSDENDQVLYDFQYEDIMETSRS